MDRYITRSLELHLFFGRIMKEHALFLQVGFMQCGPNYLAKSKEFQLEFEDLLCCAVKISNGIVGKNVLCSGEVVTKYTLESEEKTSWLTGGSINTNITKMEYDLLDKCFRHGSHDECALFKKVKELNQRSLKLLKGLIHLKECILDDVLKCKMFTANYPLLIDHILREAKLYQCYIMNLENECYQPEDLKNVELFWNRIMLEHALFIRGLLDPTEQELIVTANDFACQYEELIEEAKAMNQKTIDSITDETIRQTMKYRDFKEAGTKGINECEIRSLILPLLADHVLREANHYLRLLSEC